MSKLARLLMCSHQPPSHVDSSFTVVESTLLLSIQAL
jgi:hypothetical protein